jgi:hypothetical protein
MTEASTVLCRSILGLSCYTESCDEVMKYMTSQHIQLAYSGIIGHASSE